VAVVLLAAGSAITILLVYSQTSTALAPRCPLRKFCSTPPGPPEPPACPDRSCAPVAATTNGTTTPPNRCGTASCAAVADEPRTGAGVWRSELGFSFEIYDWLTPTEHDARSVTYEFKSRIDKRRSELHVEAVPASEATPDQLLQRRRKALADSVLGLTEDTDEETILDEPSIGFIHGVGGSFRGTTLSASLDPGPPTVVAIFAASDGRITVVFSYAVTGYKDALDVLNTRDWAEGVLSSFEWPS
jgi:hypothetical protein